jgi:hypothetical protein
LLYTLNFQYVGRYVFGTCDGPEHSTIEFYILCYKCMDKYFHWDHDVYCKYKTRNPDGSSTGSPWCSKTIGNIMKLLEAYYLKNFKDKSLGNFEFTATDIANKSKLTIGWNHY